MTEARQATECTFTTHEGVQLFYRHWPGTAPRRGCVVMFHRGHEHSGRIAHLADELNLPDFDIFAWDARGHGRSPGARGYSPTFGTSVRDVQTFIDHLHATHGIAHEDMALLAARALTSHRGGQAWVMAAALALGRSLDLWSLALLGIALASLLWVQLPLAPRIGLLISMAAGAMQKMFALRVAFDAALFRHWAANWTENWADTRDNPAARPDPDARADPASLAADLAALDQALALSGLRAHQGGASRDLESRLRGAWKLLRAQALALAIQLAAIIGAAAAMRLLPAA